MKSVILLVEDNPTDEKLTLKAFEQCVIPHEIVIARDGAAALDYLWGRERSDASREITLPDLVLLDLKLPKLNGLEVLRGIRADDRTRLLPVVVLTASREEEDVVESRRLGANAYVRKPVDFLQFVQCAKTIGLFWLHMNEPVPKRRGPS